MQKEPASNRTIFIWIMIFCLTQLAACSFVGRNVSSGAIDGPPKVDIDGSKIHDAVPKKEPLSPYGNTSYRIRGHYYRVLKNAHNYDKVGTASWYGSNFHGKLTSTMERYNLYAMTAASTELPLPTYVRVTNLANGRQTIVRVNDRGPFENHRLIDLSYAAAKKLGFVNRGVTKVRVTAIDPDTWNKREKKPVYLASKSVKMLKHSPKTKAAEGVNLARAGSKHGRTASEGGTHKQYLQIGAFASFNSAKKLSHKIAKIAHVETHINSASGKNSPLYRVKIGPLYSRAESTRIRHLLENKGLGHAIFVNS